MNWKHKLEDDKCLHGFGVADKTASWEKLNHRLQAGKNERLPIWSWIAAATVLLVMSIVIFLQNDEPGKAVLPASAHSPSHPKPEPSFPLSDPISIKKEIAVTLNENPNLNIKQPASLNTGIKPKTEKTAESSQPGIHEIEPPVISILPEIENIQTTEPDLATVPKKKLKLVHINELNESPNNLRQYSPPENFGVIKIRLNKRQVLTGTEPAAAGGNFPHVKQKIISSN